MNNNQHFIHLRLHSIYSLLEGALHIKKIPDMARAVNMPAIAISDTNNLFAALDFSEVCAANGIQPIIGCQIDIAYSTSENPHDQKIRPLPIVLLAQNETGYENLMKLNSCLYLENPNTAIHITMAQLRRYNKGLICLSGGDQGPIGRLLIDNQLEKANQLTREFAEIFDNRFYIELHRHGQNGTLYTPSQAASENYFIKMAYDLNLPLVATNNVYFTHSDMYEAHDALMCISQGAYVDQKEDRKRLTNEHYFKSPSQMIELFSDIPEAIENTVEIAKRCAFKVNKRDPILPRFANNEVEELHRTAHEGLKKRLAVIEPAASVEDYEKRLEFELGIIEKMGFPGYFLIVADFIKWAKDNSIPVGPGRGSGAGSLVAYALTITDLDPLRYSLLFERFLNPERVSMPDFDIDFCMSRREEVIRYVQQKYGRDRVGQIITFGALLSKAAIRDVGRVLQIPYMQVDRISKLIPKEEGAKPVSIIKALKTEPKLRDAANSEEIVKRMLEYAQVLEGLLRNASTHPAGIVIADRPLDELVPLYQDPRSDMPATQFNMKWIEKAGLVKFDFLGLKTLTIIQNTIDLLEKRGVIIDINTIDLAHKKTYDLYASANTIAVFQVESSGMMDALRQMKPTCIEDIVALLALYRPGPIENIPQYCDVKNGRAERNVMHPLIDHILEETQGIIIYQEQVMQIAQEMAGYSLGNADLLRRAMGKKIQAEMDEQRPLFLDGARKKGVDPKKAAEVWELLNKFANYGFNKSHAAAYAVVSYQTAWLKANYPVEFMASVMNGDIHLTDKLHLYYEEIKRLNIDILPPCINRSEPFFSVTDGKINYGLGALKNIGAEAMQIITNERIKNGAFNSLIDFAQRIPLKSIGKRPLEMLACAGSFDQIDTNRNKVMQSIDTLVSYSSAIFEARNSVQGGLFGDAGEDLPAPRLPMPNKWLPIEHLTQEHKAIGFYFSGHPLDDYMPALKREKIQTLEELKKDTTTTKTTASIAGSISGKQIRKSSKGNRFAFIQLTDPTGSYEATAFSDILDKYDDLLEVGKNVVLTIEANLESDQLKILIRHIQSADDAIANATPKGLKIFISTQESLLDIKTLLDSIVSKNTDKNAGSMRLMLGLSDIGQDAELTLNKHYLITPQTKSAIKHINGVIDVEEF